MLTSPSTGELLVALLKAKPQFQPIVKNQHVTVTTKAGRKYDYDYADLPSIQAATEPALRPEGLVLVSAVQPRPDGTVDVSTRLLHATSEQWLESCLPSGPLEDVKALGGFISYARRYNTLALLDLSGEDDVDGSQATGDHIEPRTKAVSAPASTNGHTPPPEPDASLVYPTEAHLSALRTLALETCHEDIDAFETRLRRTAGLPAHASLAPKLLCRTLKMTTYMEVYGWYVKLAEQLAKSAKEATRANDSASPPASKSATTEEPPTVPSVVASSSIPAPEDDATERDRQRLRAEVASWPLRVSEAEVEHIITHHPYSKARTLLWQARRQETAAD